LTPKATAASTGAGSSWAFTPGGIEDFFRESGQPATDDGPAPPIDKDEIARMTAAAPKYGIEIVAVDD
jgi:hypothetical protein